MRRLPSGRHAVRASVYISHAHACCDGRKRRSTRPIAVITGRCDQAIHTIFFCFFFVWFGLVVLLFKAGMEVLVVVVVVALELSC